MRWDGCIYDDKYKLYVGIECIDIYIATYLLLIQCSTCDYLFCYCLAVECTEPASVFSSLRFR